MGVGFLCRCLFCFPRLRDLSSSFAKSNDRRSCHDAHGMEGKKKVFRILVPGQPTHVGMTLTTDPIPPTDITQHFF